MKHLIGLFVIIAFIVQIIFAASVNENSMVESSNALKHFQGDSIIDNSAVVRLPRGAKHRQDGEKRRKNNKKGRKGKKQQQNGGGKKARKNGGRNKNNNNNDN
uniref:Uncharacterized protein n=1 Tax=Panagrolaimus sp. PS1159 TaxID=55785 RepID=A0AC35F9S9_9BILA